MLKNHLRSNTLNLYVRMYPMYLGLYCTITVQSSSSFHSVLFLALFHFLSSSFYSVHSARYGRADFSTCVQPWANWASRTWQDILHLQCGTTNWSKQHLLQWCTQYCNRKSTGFLHHKRRWSNWRCQSSGSLLYADGRRCSQFGISHHRHYCDRWAQTLWMVWLMLHHWIEC